MKKQAFTLVEIMVVVIISAITMVPVYLIYRSGMRSSISGMASLEIQSEGEKLLLQIYDDLKNACLPYDGELKLKFSDLIKVEHIDTSSLAGLNYSFHSFMRDENKLIGSTGNGKALRATRKIKYLIEKTDNPRLFALFRSEQTKSDGIVKRLVSNRVAFFQINPVTIPSRIDDSSQYFWQVTIQLAELPESLPAGTYATNRSLGIIIADFYQIVSCDFFSNVINFPHVNRNWYSGLEMVDQ